MKNPLESLDELILNKVFEPITQYAHKKLGWTKYDLMNLTSSSASAGYAGAAFYNCLNYIQERNPANLIYAGVDALIAFVFWNFKKNFAKDEERDIKLALQSSAVRAPTSIPIRPLGLGFGLCALFKGSTDIALENDPAQNVGNLTVTSLGMGISLVYSFLYFKDTTFFPPRAEKKKFFKTLYEGIKSKIPGVKVPEPVTVPVQNYSLEESFLE